MLIPSHSCPASCSYCFGPHHGTVMSPETLNAALDFMGRLTALDGQRKARVTFHGSKPPAAGDNFMERALGLYEATRKYLSLEEETGNNLPTTPACTAARGKRH